MNFAENFENFDNFLTKFAEILRKSSRWLEPMASSRRLEPASSRLFASPVAQIARAFEDLREQWVAEHGLHFLSPSI